MIQPVNLVSIFKQPKTSQIQTTYKPKYNINFATKPDTFERTTAPVSTKQLSFTGYKNDEPIRALGNIACPCCGVTMLTQKDLNKVTKGLGCTSKQAIETLNNYEDNMRPIEKQCFNLLKDWSKNEPNSNFKDLLLKNREPQLEILQGKQNKILDSVNEIAKTLSPDEQEAVNKVTETTRKLVSSNDKEIKFKRKSFIKDIEDLESKISNKKAHEKILKEAEKMPTSQNDVSAFVVKYAERGHKEIGLRLVKLSVGTIEHIHPQSEGGKDRIDNYLLECGGCNHERSSIPLGKWVDNHPEMKKNTQKYIDAVIERINSGKMKGFEFYPSAVARTLLFESEGKLDLNVKGLKQKD